MNTSTRRESATTTAGTASRRLNSAGIFWLVYLAVFVACLLVPWSVLR